MKNFKHSVLTPLLIAAAAVASGACSRSEYQAVPSDNTDTPAVKPTLADVARLFAALPLSDEHLQEVHDAAASSSGNGYDEEYTLRNLFENPGAGVGSESKATARSYGNPLRDVIGNYLATEASTKAFDPEAYITALEESGYQVYWPYSEDWDGHTMPVITFDPGYGSEYNKGWDLDGNELVVDEQMALERPVWIINNNEDSGFTPLELILREQDSQIEPMSQSRTLKLKDFTMLKNYDSWFGGASEFWIKIGTVDGFKASTEAELKLYTPSVTDFMVVVKRKYKGIPVPLDVILLTDFTNQLDNLAFLITEDDGGTTTSWKCSASVKIKSKTYGFDLDIPYNDKDDLVWRGQLSASYFQSEDEVCGRFGDVMVTFELD